MRLQRLFAIAFTASCATLASAQATSPRQTNEGFFRPSADADLTAPRPGDIKRPTEDLVAEDRVQANDAVQPSRAPDPAKVIEFTERQMDRSVEEADRATPAPGTPPPITGAFTGSTSERDR
jgi:hypothetical protein